MLPLPFDGPLDYLVPDGISLAVGDFVSVPLGSRKVNGVVWARAQGDVATDRLKYILERHDIPPMREDLRKFLDWVANYNMASPGATLRMAVSVPDVFGEPVTQTLYRRGGVWPDRMTAAREQVKEVLIDDQPRSVRDLMELALVGEGVIRGLIREQTLLPVDVAVDEPFEQPDPGMDGHVLSGDQRAAAEQISGAVGALCYKPFLLEGVTGSGKTEVYFESVAAALQREGGQVLVLLPEIALTAQWLDRFQQRFGAPPAQWHSDMTAGQRRRTWMGVATGDARVIVGARSALFLPFRDLRLIIVDEEHDGAFKQEEGVIYHARDMAVVRASTGKLPIVLASATPSLETVVNAQTGRYTRLHLADRHGGAEMPDIQAIDMRQTPPDRGQFLSPPLKEALIAGFAAGEQALLFLNRRGYAPLTLCRACGHRMECPNCSAWLVEHRFDSRLQCHHCGFSARRPTECPSCHEEDSLVPCGPGVERIAEEVSHIMPDARMMVLTSDVATSPSKTAALISQVTNHEIDIVIGTQIVAKGYHFPKLTLVGVVDADLGLNGGDLRAGERTSQQLAQVAGRAGREQTKGRVLMQTYLPEHPVMEALVSGDREAFMAREASMRESLGMPPFGRLVALIVSGPDQAAAIATARELSRTAPKGQGISVLGPAPAPMSLLRGRFRFRLLMKADKQTAVQPLVRAWMQRARISGGGHKSVRVQIDIDPMTFM